ncbi:MAG: Ldh family oxidoreductase [SAR202 cluster bacterium]|nr:Ldh family oxidoreductase [SAR202 cluster bacterium]
MAFNIDVFTDVTEFKADMDRLLNKLAKTTPAP